MLPLRPLIAVIGTTGTGKSKLAIDIAKYLNGAEIINADAMQVYAGMDIITNKVSEREMDGIPHHLLGFQKPGKQYVVGEWVQDSMRIIKDLHAQNKVPIVVGGTAYWIQHLVFPGSVNYEEPAIQKGADGQIALSDDLARNISLLSPAALSIWTRLAEDTQAQTEEALPAYQLLQTLDPQMAARWHWRDVRKVVRSLVIMKTSGRLASERVMEQSRITVQPRYRTLFLWPYAKSDVMNPRLDARVDDMLERGLIREVKDLLDLKDTEGETDMDFETGIYQSIGYREFFTYLSAPDREEDRESLASAVSNMKTSTRQYAKRQISWIRNKLLPEVRSANVSSNDNDAFYMLDVSDINAWDPKVRGPALDIVNQFLRGQVTLDPSSVSEDANGMLAIPEKITNPIDRLEAQKKMVCDLCTTDKDQPVMVETLQWDAHARSRKHRRRIQTQGKKEQYMEYRRRAEEAASS
ncbi:tRNA isopentenyltransferase [Cylindrobasidium torrendii FP15055 ss-10]|uniref:tRNA isopentenyltransferase n=1 Tax=Cylindrobasidium torrendii FP15055 ss-10 TaxID=1314674 RepID=A0A0D7B6A8_9AGAR|nr:tRNA isopentenyltransferase [Cylindrobasidium torrendii FP15055 ss-10]